MSKFIYFYAIFIINYLLTIQKLCGSNEIEHCIECDNDNKEICKKCENKYFVLFAGLKCISCNDKNYGQPACEGNCDSSRYNDIDNVLCDKCKEGYYSIEGFCTPCLDGSENCVKCSYEASQESDKKIYTCLDCVGGLNGEYRVSEDGTCRKCRLPSFCLECRYKIGTYDVECIKCKDDYYLSNGICNKCYYQSNVIEGGICYKYYCPGVNHNKNNYSNCNNNYVKKNERECILCPSNCNYNYCYYDQSANQAKCSKCNSYYALTPQGTCISCPDHCSSCDYDQSANSIKCNSCLWGYVLASDGKCILCPSNCDYSYCHYEQSTNIARCSKCNSEYVLTNLNTCIPCPKDCYSCDYDQSTNSAKCNHCFTYYAISDQGTCISCPSNCNTCDYDKNTTSTKCNNCFNRYAFTPSKECTSCGEGCGSCYFNNGQIICTNCDYKYALDTTNNKCIHCPSNCTYCHFNNSSKLICDNCDLDYVLNEAKLCEFCTNNEEIGGEGCLHCKYDNGINKCTDCRNDYIHVDNDYVCKLPSEINLNIGCRNATRLENGEYTCNRCRSISYTMMTRYNSTNDCYPAENELVNCEKGYEDENKNLTCTNAFIIIVLFGVRNINKVYVIISALLIIFLIII